MVLLLSRPVVAKEMAFGEEDIKPRVAVLVVRSGETPTTVAQRVTDLLVEHIITLDLFDIEGRETHRLAQCKRTTMGYPHQQISRQEGETVVAFLARGNWGINKKYIVQAHPAWDRTGRYVAFNSDATGESQVYVIDLAELGFYDV